MLGYDGRGNLTSSTASEVTTTFGYNLLNLMTTRSSGAASATMLYDASGRLVSLTAGGSTTQMAYAGANLALERNAGGILRRYVFGPGDDNPVVWYEGAGTADRRWLQGDERGSVVAVSDASGASVAINRYDEYGIPQSGNVGRFQYTGQTWWGEVGLYNYKARWYSPTLGRFMQTDPIGYKDQINLYAYVGNDPVNRVDPSGQQGEPTVIGCQNPNNIPMGDGSRSAGYRCVPTFAIEDRLPKSTPQTLPKARPPQNDKPEEEEDASCRILRETAEAAQDALPSRVGLNGGFRDPANLTFYRLTYEQNLGDAGYAEYALYGAAVLSGVGGYYGVIGAGSSLAAGTGAGTSGLFVDALGDKYRQYIQAIQDIEKYNESGCNDVKVK